MLLQPHRCNWGLSVTKKMEESANSLGSLEKKNQIYFVNGVTGRNRVTKNVTGYKATIVFNEV